ncbi:transferase [Streptomyces sp. NPDC050560]|uniref:transferase n=1 Tax=Streptomyces sp. NPDC050560 TaxID=3365630 RepID=UPI00379B1DDA
MTRTPATEPRAHCTAAADGTLTWLLDPPAATAPALVLTRRRKQGREQAPGDERTLPLTPTPEGGRRAVLPPEPPLAEGRWDTWALLDDGTRHRLRPGLRDLRLLTEGAARDRPSPVAVRIPYPTKDGYLALRTWLRTAHAEAETLRVTPGTMTVRARLHGATTGPGAAVLLRERAHGAVRELEPTRRTDQEIEFTVGYAALFDEGKEAARGRVLDVFVRPRQGADRVRVGRLLDDLADRKAVSVYPAATVHGTAVRPYFTVDNDLALDVGGAAV